MKRQYTWRDGPIRSPTFHYYIRTAITIFACSPPMQMFVADKLGYGTIFLAGLNWSEYKGKRRSTEYSVKPIAAGYKCPCCEYVYVEDPDKKVDDFWCPSCGRYPETTAWEAHPNPYTETGVESNGDLVISNNGRKTRAIHLYYKKNLLSAWRLSHQTMYNTDEMGILTEVPYTSIIKVMQKQGKNYPVQSHAMVDRITERYLASVGAFVIVTEKGVAFVESDNPGVELRKFMEGVSSRYRCDKCGSEVVAEDGKDHQNEACPGGCGGNIHRVTEVDIEGNMRRIDGHIALAKARADLP
jgi:DNA-directed RNA polymerase subunit RPC12/RpoP